MSFPTHPCLVALLLGALVHAHVQDASAAVPADAPAIAAAAPPATSAADAHAQPASDAASPARQPAAASPSSAAADAVEQPEQAQPPRDALGGIVVSRTITVAGQDFSQHFLAVWRDKPGSEHHSLVIFERPSARWGSEVWIDYAQRRVFHARLPTMRAALRRAAEQAADATFEAVLHADMQRKLVKEPDLGPDEF